MLIFVLILGVLHGQMQLSISFSLQSLRMSIFVEKSEHFQSFSHVLVRMVSSLYFFNISDNSAFLTTTDNVRPRPSKMVGGKGVLLISETLNIISLI